MLVTHAARLEKIGDVAALWDGIVETLQIAGIDHAIYLTVDAKFGNLFMRSTHDRIYAKTPPEDDPFLHYACNSYDIRTIGSEFVHTHPYITDEERAFIERAGRKGFSAALGIPMRLQGTDRFGGFIVGNGMDQITFTNKILPRAEEIRLFCLLMHRRLEELAFPEPRSVAPEFRTPLLAPSLPDAFDALSPREREVVYLIAQGRSRVEAADICGISVHTVSDYVKSGYRKLGVNNRAQAAAILHGKG